MTEERVATQIGEDDPVPAEEQRIGEGSLRPEDEPDDESEDDVEDEDAPAEGGEA